MKILSRVNYTEQDHNNFPSVFPDAYDISSVLLYVKDVYLSRALVDELRKRDCTTFYTQQVADDVLYIKSVSDSVQRFYEVHYKGYSLRLVGSNTSKEFYLADVLFNGRSVKTPTNMRSAYLYLDIETIQLNNSNQKKLAPY